MDTPSPEQSRVQDWVKGHGGVQAGVEVSESLGAFFLFIFMPMEKAHSLRTRNTLCGDLLVFLEWWPPYDNCQRPGREPAEVWKVYHCIFGSESLKW